MVAAGPPTGTVGVVGLGLIGGSITLDGLVQRWDVVATDTDQGQREAAAAAGVTVVDGPAAVAAVADLVVVATPAREVAPVLLALDEAASRPLLATAVASVQDPGVLGIDALRLERVRHLGGHPMTGTERSGFRAARRGMFDGAPWIVTATPSDLVGDLRAVVDLAVGLGASPVVVPPREHDRAVALLSHLPHVLAYALYGRLAATGDVGAELLAGGSFRDATRVAATTPGFWAAVLDLNRDAVADLVGEVRDSLADVERLLREGAPADAIEGWLGEGHRPVGRRVPATPPPTPLPAADHSIGDASFTELRTHTGAGLAISGWAEGGAAVWSPM